MSPSGNGCLHRRDPGLAGAPSEHGRRSRSAASPIAAVSAASGDRSEGGSCSAVPTGTLARGGSPPLRPGSPVTVALSTRRAIAASGSGHETL
jgi:hypothetical protein